MESTTAWSQLWHRNRVGSSKSSLKRRPVTHWPTYNGLSTAVHKGGSHWSYRWDTGGILPPSTLFSLDTPRGAHLAKRSLSPSARSLVKSANSATKCSSNQGITSWFGVRMSSACEVSTTNTNVLFIKKHWKGSQKEHKPKQHFLWLPRHRQRQVIMLYHHYQS